MARLAAGLMLGWLCGGAALAQQDVESALRDADAALRAAERALNQVGGDAAGADQAAASTTAADEVRVDATGVRVGDAVQVDASGVRVNTTGAVTGGVAATGKIFRNGEFDSANYAGADFSGATFMNYDFDDSDFSNADFSNAVFQNVDFNNTNLQGACFAGATIRNTDFDARTRLDGAIMTGAIRSNNDIDADLRNVVFHGQDCGRQVTDAVELTRVEVRAEVTDAAVIVSRLAQGADASIDLTVNFATDSDQIRAQARAQVLEIANALSSDTLAAQRVLIEGHTDSVGDAEYNLDLSYRRAISVMRSLTDDYNIDSQRLSVKGYGEAQPIADNQHDDGRTLNRRVTLRNLAD